MKRNSIAAALTVLLGLSTPAGAQTDSDYAFCIQQMTGPPGTAMLMCRYRTREQCLASRSSPSDTCFPNPGYKGKK